MQPNAVSENVSLTSYQPFAERNRTVTLEEASTLQLHDNLPRIDGATALYPLYAAFVQAVYPEDDYYPLRTSTVNYPLVTSSTTALAFTRLINGDVDVIFTAMPSESQFQAVAERGLEFHMTPIGREAFVFFVNRRNPISNLTTEEIIKIYTGQITNWSELGGTRDNIRVYQRARNSGSQTMLEHIMGDNELIEAPTEDVYIFMRGIVEQTASYRNFRTALGYSFLFYTTQMVQNNEIKLLSINGIYPSRESIIDNTYPYSDVFYAITINTDNENVNKLIEWILSDQGQYLVEKTGYVPY